MADVTGSQWRIYPNDAPGVVGRDSPEISELFIHRIVWTPDAGSTSGDTVHIKDRRDRTIFFHEAVSGETFFEKEFVSPVSGPLTLDDLDSGVVEVFLY